MGKEEPSKTTPTPKPSKTQTKGKPQKPAPPPKPVAPAIPPAQRTDFQVSGAAIPGLNCRTALLFPDNSALAALAVDGKTRRARPPVGIRGDKSESTWLDLQATWAHVTKPPEPKGAAVLVALHGHGTYVTIDVNGACALPSWANTNVTVRTTKTDAKGKGGPTCFADGYGLYDAIQRYPKSLIALFPENAHPFIQSVWHPPKDGKRGSTEYPRALPAQSIICGVGDFKNPDTLGKLIDECLLRLTKVTTAAGQPKCPSSPLASVPTITRLFLAGHSGAHQGLYKLAESTLARQKPTDLILLDCFYHPGHAALKTFADNAPGGLGNGADQSRIIMVHDPGSYDPGVSQFQSMKDSLLAGSHKSHVVDVKFKSGKTARETQLNAMAAAKIEMTNHAIVLVNGSLGHYTIPQDYIPLVLETAK